MQLCSTRRAVLLAALALPLSAAAALAQETTIQIAVKDKRFEPSEIRAPAGKPIVIRIKNNDAKAIEFESHAMKVEKVIAPGAEGTVRVRALKPGRYEFMDDFNQSNRGTLVVE